ncbi:uncharacterized protein LTR77_008154 [Saxophila tyrrhenica]|uniref:Epoxide hydrolase N-terminal domain-containing protein n=1 Tax=Saxophila tyrrhenica TaxID=1690608 RepID=A0AAV9P5S9_9PEZI|nr:hypothetical protein LTR77_008154 [Saxophila tyrrhenica]
MASGSRPTGGVDGIQPYRMSVSQKYLDLTRQKLQLTRLPRDPRNAQSPGEYGVSKNDLEPLIDHWLESYDWRAQESFYNDTLPQYRVPVNGTRLHFVHKKSQSPNALPLLFVHGFPESFVTAAKVVDALCDPIATPPRGDEDVQNFNVVVPSISGFGFSDPIAEAGNNMQATAEVFNTLMAGLGYHRYIAHGTGWGFNICRILALTHPNNCVAVHTVNPDVPAPRFAASPFLWLKLRLVKLTYLICRSVFGYGPEDWSAQTTPSLTPGAGQWISERPQTTAYALADSPSGLLAFILDAIRPPSLRSPAQSSPGGNSPEYLRTQTPGRSPISPQTYTTPQTGRSPSNPAASHSPQNLELNDLASAWNPTALLNWTMLYWLPGPEVALRWLVNSSKLVPSLWLGHCGVPLGISYFHDPGSANAQTPPQWTEAYFRVAMVQRREGRVRFPAWERPAELVIDLREFAGLLGLTGGGPAVTNGY